MTELQEDDYKLFPCGSLGGLIGVSYEGKRLGEFTEMKHALEFVKEHMDGEQYWPNIWWVSGHGNIWMIDVDGNEVKDG